MERWRGKVAVVTGASAGIGLAVVKALISEGLTVVGLARRKDKMLDEMKNVEGPGKFIPKECDIVKAEDVVEAFKFIKESYKTVHLLVNNAGIMTLKSIQEADLKEMQRVIDINFVGLLHCSKQAVKLMKENNHEAHIINISSSAGHKVPNFTFPDGTKFIANVYSPTKFAVTSLSEVLVNELLGGKIRVTNLSPGNAQTDLAGTTVEEKKSSPMPSLHPEDIANAVVYVVGTPQHVQITELSIKPLGETF